MGSDVNVPEEAVEAAVRCWDVESDADHLEAAMRDVLEASAPAIRSQERGRMRAELEKAQTDMQQRWERARGTDPDSQYENGARAGELAVCNLARDILATLLENLDA